MVAGKIYHRLKRDRDDFFYCAGVLVRCGFINLCLINGGVGNVFETESLRGLGNEWFGFRRLILGIALGLRETVDQYSLFPR